MPSRQRLYGPARLITFPLFVPSVGAAMIATPTRVLFARNTCNPDDENSDPTGDDDPCGTSAQSSATRKPDGRTTRTSTNPTSTGGSRNPSSSSGIPGSDHDSSSNSHNRLSGGAIAGIVIAALFVLLLLIFSLWWRRRRLRNIEAARNSTSADKLLPPVPSESLTGPAMAAASPPLLVSHAQNASGLSRSLSSATMPNPHDRAAIPTTMYSNIPSSHRSVPSEQSPTYSERDSFSMTGTGASLLLPLDSRVTSPLLPQGSSGNRQVAEMPLVEELTDYQKRLDSHYTKESEGGVAGSSAAAGPSVAVPLDPPPQYRLSDVDDGP
ncbi:hypothetical protein C8Q75DRAFT_749493 [Abortiporus biennis]|nr:hypothetical protein C8Q75DRAFT_749493 [Abortiporus biennis]